MQNYDIVYIKGNPSSGTLLQHDQINNSVIELIKSYSYEVIDSQEKNLSGVKIPKAKVYIGFSRGSRYLNKLDKSSLKISIGGISGTNVHLFTNSEDKILLGDISDLSIQGHFIICDRDKIKIKSLIDSFLL
ncbi:MAG: hypothetical protein C0626_06985 [Arcobacter sp.]|uniref:hypothetical protein n=1 Tax=uncultured Arcobacter sp. TaxID=165434 RepID=UPI000CAC2B75|nr:hypothetical protein [uncultured Arcobacter sp.]PLY10017.1 MAG: hypothetical protein C0626_06985 [Arcobacter sp.]